MVKEEFEERLLEDVRAFKDKIKANYEFESEQVVRSTYVVMLTLQGALMYDDTDELAQICVEFCRAKEIEATEAN